MNGTRSAKVIRFALAFMALTYAQFERSCIIFIDEGVEPLFQHAPGLPSTLTMWLKQAASRAGLDETSYHTT